MNAGVNVENDGSEIMVRKCHFRLTKIHTEHNAAHVISYITEGRW